MRLKIPLNKDHLRFSLEARSAEKVVSFKFAHSTGNNQADYTHQDSYAHPQVLASALYAIVKIAGTATWWEK